MRYLYLIFPIFLLHCSNNSVQSPKETATPESLPAAPPQDSVPQEEVSFLMGNFDPAKDARFVPVKAPHTAKTGMRLQKETYDAFQKMWTAAKADGVQLTIISSTRNFAQQKNIWEGKWKRYEKETPDPAQRARRILEYSSMPGTSRHHWGTDIDLNDLSNSSFEKGGSSKKVYDWLTAHAAQYGFGQPYTVKDESRPEGYNEEKWHWSYLPLSKKYRNAYLHQIKNEDISGFQGAATAVELQVVKYFVGGVSPVCQ